MTSYHWHSTRDGSEPNPEIKEGTFQDVDLSSLNCVQVDIIDSECLKQGVPRSELLRTYGLPSIGEKLLIPISANLDSDYDEPEFQP